MKDNYYIDKIILSGAHSLILSHKPNEITLDQVAKKLEVEKQDISQNGLFDSSAPNYTTYYPDVKLEDLNPSPESFIRPTFRALSQVIVHKKTNPVDFSKPGVLESSMNKLKAQTVNIDHETSIGNAIGSVSAVSYQQSYIAQGIKVPAGINVDLLIDGKSHPNISRKIMMNPPAIHSTSVTVRFAWEPSHKFENIKEFVHKIGTTAKDGSIIRRVVTDILNYNEISLVSHGADPFAQLIGEDGKIVNPIHAGSIESLSAQGKEKPQHYYFNYKTDTISNSTEVDDTSNSNNNNTPKIAEMKEHLLKLAKVLNIEDFVNLDEAALAVSVDSAIASILKTNAEVENKDSEIDQLKEDLKTEYNNHTELKTEVEGLDLEAIKNTDLTLLGERSLEEVVADAAIGAEAMELQRSECARIYRTLKEDKVDETILSSFAKADFKILTSYINDYSEQLNSKFPGKCNDCNSTNVARNSSITPAPGSDSIDIDNIIAPLSDTEVLEEFNAPNSGGANTLHGVTEKKS